MLKKDFGVISAMVLSLFIQRRHTVQAQNLTQKYFQTTSEYHFIQQCACPLSQYTAHSVTFLREHSQRSHWMVGARAKVDWRRTFWSRALMISFLDTFDN